MRKKTLQSQQSQASWFIVPAQPILVVIDDVNPLKGGLHCLLRMTGGQLMMTDASNDCISKQIKTEALLASTKSLLD